MEFPEVCPTCETATKLATKLPDGTLFCGACRNLVPAVAEVPEVVTAPLNPSLDPDFSDNDSWNDDDAEVVAFNPPPPIEEPPAPVPDSDTAAVTAVPAAVSAPSPETNGSAPSIDDDTGDGPNVVLLRMLIGLMLRAGAMSIGKDGTPIEPPTGWLPPPADALPEIGGAAALAIATLIFTCEIQISDVIALANSFLEDPNDNGEVEQ